MRILMINPVRFLPAPRGDSVNTLNICQLLAKMGNTVYVIVLKSKDQKAFETLSENLLICRLPLSLPSFSELGRSLSILLKGTAAVLFSLVYSFIAVRKFKIDVICVRDNWPLEFFPFISVLIGVLTRKPLLMQFFGTKLYKSVRYRFLEKIFIKFMVSQARTILSGSLAVAEDLSNMSSKKIYVIPPFIDPEFFRIPSKEYGYYRWKLGLQDAFVIFYGGQMSKDDGLDKLVLSAPSAIQKIPEAKFLFVGQGDQKRKLEEMVHKIGLEKYFLFLNAVDHSEMPHLLATVDICVVIADPELRPKLGIPLKLLEYGVMKKPVIATKPHERMISKLVKGITDKECVYAVDFNHEDISKAIVNLHGNKELSKKLSENLYRVTLERFSMNYATKMYREILEATQSK
jgi:glycosyltransferase involved in cell wall biosynthesis